MEPTVTPVVYTVSCVPPDIDGSYLFTLRVERRDINPDRWCVTDGAFCYATDGTKKVEPLRDNRTAAFRRQYRFALDDALDLAKRLAPTLTVNGLTVTDMLTA